MKVLHNFKFKGAIYLSLFGIVISLFIFFSCQKEEAPGMDQSEQKVSFSINISDSGSLSGSRNSETPTPKAVIVSVKNSKSEYVKKDLRLNLYVLNESFVSDVITLPPGEYTLTDFFVLDASNEILYATPMAGSDLAYLVNNPLPITFNVIADVMNMITPEVISTEDKEPEDFGYSTFSFSEVRTFDFYVNVFILEEGERTPVVTSADIVINGDDHEVYSGKLSNITNLILLNEIYENYEVIITKDRYNEYRKLFTKAEMMHFGKLPLSVTLIGSEISLTLITQIKQNGSIQPNFIENMIIPSATPSRLLLVVRNEGANCGYGTPVSVWSVDLSSDSHPATFIQSLSDIQTTRGALFENSHGELFTGSGWCGYKPPYRSTDNGKSWAKADQGAVHPPNSTFSLCEFNGDTYISTGYAPYNGEVYKWLGGGNWERVLVLPQPRTLVDILVVFDNTLFVGSSNYLNGVSVGGYPVMISKNGTNFTGTSGIESKYSINAMKAADNHLIAISSTFTEYNYLSGWKENTWTKPEKMEFTQAISKNLIVALNGAFYVYSITASDPIPGIFKSIDYGKTWTKILDWEAPRISNMYQIDNDIYIGTYRDEEYRSSIYRLNVQ